MTPPSRAPLQWRSLEQLADTPAFRRFVEREFPAVTDLCQGPERRRFLQLMAASLSLAGLAGCDDKPDNRSQEVPPVRMAGHARPGEALDYATLAPIEGFANGVLATTRNGRPLKIEGNPAHPWSRGGTDPSGQATILDLYDPTRSQAVLRLGHASDRHAFAAETAAPFAALRAGGGEGLALLTGPVTSPTTLTQIAALRAAMPAMRWHMHGLDRRAVYEGTRRAFGRRLEPRWRFAQARVVVALDGDFLDPGPGQVGHTADWAAARRASAARGGANGPGLLVMHAAASVPNLTSAKADHALPADPATLLALAERLADPAPARDDGPMERWRARAAAALHANPGAGLVVAGSHAPPALQEAVHRLNARLGNLGRTCLFTEPALPEAPPIAELASAMAAGRVRALLMLDANPVYDAPGALDFAGALERVPLRIHAGPYANETAARCDWHLPLAHPLESWGDARALDGTVGLMQPTVEPLYDGLTPAAILSAPLGAAAPDTRALLRAQWAGHGDWEEMLRAGFVPGTAFPLQAPPLVAPSTGAAPASAPAAPPSIAPAPGPTLLFRPDPTIRDGAQANNGWLQELPKPLTKLVWENAIGLAPALAAREGIATGDMLRVEAGGRALEGPAWIMPGQADDTLALALGYGRATPGQLSDGLGYAAAVLLPADGGWERSGATMARTGRRISFATTQDHNTMEGHDFVRVHREGAPPVEHAPEARPSLYGGTGREPEGAEPATAGPATAAWAMAIDLDACTGCNACVVACQAENNIAVVGREQVALGREMHWLRVDRYYEGPPESPITLFQPVPCMHCEDAPCEVGCPVEATLHDSEGLNLMVYNRCVGTRACSGYCPYKVRHFNYLDYSAGAAPALELQRNPEVTVRARGVMEKCTYCVQRIEQARIEADKADRPISEGAVQTACQGACPSRAISFGDLNQPGGEVAAARRDPRHYALLGELNTRPRTTYLAARAPADG